ncbi:acyltransferase family protein [Dorea sp. AF24-7LB]|uniref:acyltransferase family protein n=1 Tax=Dorea sp. AF24-7LB TaxID=2293097 RepID=UPI001FAA4331|nr:acyltransferase family protein [Dorea sp. AF24-7LB]
MEKKIQKKRKYIKEIDGLRALAVIMVLAYHLKMPFAKSGLLGVTVFFVISGYLITGILINEIEESGGVDLKNFWLRRIRRLLPAVLSMAVVMIFVSAVVNRVVFTKGCNDLLSAVFGYNNWWQIFRKVSYFENAGAPSPFTHCWSLAIETQFYLIYPILLILLSKARNRGKVFAAVTAVLAMISVVLMGVLYSPDGDPSRVYYGTDTRAFSLLIGALAAIQKEYHIIKVKLQVKLWAVIGSISVLILIGMMMLISSYSSFLYYGGQAIVSVLVAFVVYAVTVSRSLLNIILDSSILKWIGDRSYSIYLWHYPIIVLMSGGKRAAWWIVILEVVLSVGFAELSYRFIETPVRHGIIGEYIGIINSRPHNRRERHRQIQVARRSLKAMAAVLATGLALSLCIAFVPKKTTLDTVAKREKKATEVTKLTNQKLKEQKAKKTAKTSKSTMTDEELLKNVQMLLIGDSITVDVTDYFYKVLPNSISDTKIGRSTLTGVKVFDEYQTQKKWDGDGVIFALGTNGPMYDTLGRIRQKVGDKPLFLTTVHAPKEDFESSNNEEIRKFVKEHEHTYLIDWYTASADHPEYFDQDDTHLLPKGAEAYAQCIKDAVLKAMRAEEKVNDKV